MARDEPRSRESTGSTIVAALLVGLLLLGGYRCTAVKSCSRACVGASGYSVQGLDACECVEPPEERQTASMGLGGWP